MKQTIILDINYYKERNMKPNFTQLAKTHNVDRRTIKKYYNDP